MIIESIELTNYRQYRNTKLTFSDLKDGKNFTIIQGINGAGKTNILNAITWCLFDKELHLDKKNKGLPIYNIHTFNTVNTSDDFTIEVKLNMKDDEDNKMIITRTLDYKKKDKTGARVLKSPRSSDPDGSEIKMLRQNRQDMINIDGAKEIIKGIFPEEVEPYFFFDGERLGSYFEEKSSEEIKKAVYDISQLELLQKVIDHLKESERDIRNTVAKSNPKAKEIEERRKYQENKLDNLKEERWDLKQQYKGAETKEEEFSKKLLECEVKNVPELQDEKVSLIEESKGLAKKLDDTIDHKINVLIEYAQSIYAFKAVVKTQTKIEDAELAGEIPPQYKKEFLVGLLRKKECICGTHLIKGSEHWKMVEELSNGCSVITDITKEIVEENAQLRDVIDSIQKNKEKIQSFSIDIVGIEERNVAINKRIRTIEGLIKGYDVDKISFWQAKEKEYRKIKKALGVKIAENKAANIGVKGALESIKEEWEREVEKELRLVDERKKLKFCEVTRRAAEKIKGEIMHDVREQIEEKTKCQFFELIWKKDTFKDVKIDENYKISVTHQSGFEALSTLAAGEKLALALSFMAALHTVSGFRLPIIIDTPIGRLDEIPRSNIAENLPKYLPNTQVTFLMLKTEYTGDFRDKLIGNIGNEMKLDHNESKWETEVIAYGE